MARTKENKPASAYYKQGLDSRLEVESGAKVMEKMNPSIAGISKGNFPPQNRHGEIEMRGVGAAIKGTKCRGPMG
jgi:hypothetical protein